MSRSREVRWWPETRRPPCPRQRGSAAPGRGTRAVRRGLGKKSARQVPRAAAPLRPARARQRAGGDLRRRHAGPEERAPQHRGSGTPPHRGPRAAATTTDTPRAGPAATRGGGPQGARNERPSTGERGAASSGPASRRSEAEAIQRSSLVRVPLPVRLTLGVLLVVLGAALLVIALLGMRRKLRRNRGAGVRRVASARSEGAFAVANQGAAAPRGVAGGVAVAGGAALLAGATGVFGWTLFAVRTRAALVLTGVGGVAGDRAAAAVPLP